MSTPDYHAVFEAYQEGDLGLVLRWTKHWLRNNCYDGRAWELLGLAQYARGCVNNAVAALERAALIIPLRPAARVCLGQGYGRLGRRELARDLLAELIDDESITIPLLLQVASGLDALGEPGLAVQACRAAIARDPNRAQPYYDLGYYSARCGCPPHIIESLARKAIALDPANVCYRVGLASWLIHQHRQDEAYLLVERLTDEQIRRIPCPNCLQRIIDLYETAHDYRRSVVGREYLLRLELRGRSSNCG